MERALQLARTGVGRVEPNPCVGAVIVDDHLRELGAGCHEVFGGPHAAVMALRAAGSQALGATLFVTLEPCNHHGQTPPCTQAVVAAGIKRVVIATRDPADHKAGSGIETLRALGIPVQVELYEPEAQELIRPFATLLTQGRAYVHAKWAMTLDGKIASRAGHSKWISNEESRKRVHTLRARMDGIITGIGTVLADDPLLTARPRGPRIPARIVLDSRARLPLDSQLVQTLAEAPLLLATTSEADEDRIGALRAAGVEILMCEPEPENSRCCLSNLLTELGRRRMTNVLIEAGSHVLGAFHDQLLIDEVHCFIAPKILGGTNAPGPVGGTGLSRIPQQADLLSPTVERLGDDLYLHGVIRREPI